MSTLKGVSSSTVELDVVVKVSVAVSASVIVSV